MATLTAKVNAGKAEVFVDYFTDLDGMKKLGEDNRLAIKRSYKEIDGDGVITPGDIIEIRPSDLAN